MKTEESISTKQIALIVILFIVSNFILYKTIDFMFNPPMVSKCGLVIQKYSNNDERYHKSHSHSSINRYFDMKYDDGLYEQVIVSTDTYCKNQVGSRVCFSEQKHYEGNFFCDVFHFNNSGYCNNCRYCIVCLLYLYVW